MNLFFQNSLGNERLIASDLSSKQECYDEINKFLDDHNFTSYYCREWKIKNRTFVDVGSHTEFFIIEGCWIAPQFFYKEK